MSNAQTTCLKMLIIWELGNTSTDCSVKQSSKYIQNRTPPSFVVQLKLLNITNLWSEIANSKQETPELCYGYHGVNHCNFGSEFCYTLNCINCLNRVTPETLQCVCDQWDLPSQKRTSLCWWTNHFSPWECTERPRRQKTTLCTSMSSDKFLRLPWGSEIWP